MKKNFLKILSLLIPALMIFALMSQSGYAAIVSNLTSWGNNFYGQCTVPSDLLGVKAIAAGGYYTVALKEDGTVVAWGDNTFGQCEVPADLNSVVAIEAGSYHTLALKEDGTVVRWGNDNYLPYPMPPDLDGVKAISAGAWHSVALKEDGTLVTWGSNSYNLNTVPPDLFGVKAIAAGGYHSVALKEDGTLVAWGYNDYGISTVPSGLVGVKAIAAGIYHTLALKENGTVVAWGDNNEGQCTVPSDLIDVKAIVAGTYHSLALKEDGTVVAWGNNNLGQCEVPVNLKGVVAITAGNGHNIALYEYNPDEENVAPVIGDISAPVEPKQLNTLVDGFSATFEDAGILDTHTATWDWGDGTTGDGIVTEESGSGSVSGTHTYTAAGTYTVSLKVMDNKGDFSTATFEYIVIYDPSAGFVTGGGSIDSLPGYFTSDPTLEGKAIFAFVSKYQKGASIPTGNTSFLFKAAEMNFKSTTYHWLVVSGNATRAQFKGVGTINGDGNFGFMLTAIDSKDTGDQFRIKIWDINSNDVVVYDNRLGEADNTTTLTSIAGGTILIHK